MPLPSGVSTATYVFGKDTDILGSNARVKLRVTPSHTVVWEATGERLVAFDVEVEADEGVTGSFQLPHVDQPGFLDVSGAAVTNWYYTVQGTATVGRQSKAFRKVLQPVVGQTTIDLDTVVENATVLPVGVVQQAAVTSVNGQTGAVSIGLVEDPLNPGLYIIQ